METVNALIRPIGLLALLHMSFGWGRFGGYILMSGEKTM
jgi:hypothetical protein